MPRRASAPAPPKPRPPNSSSDAISEGNVNALNYFLGQKYVDAFAQLATAPNQKFVVLPMEATALLGSLAGISELARESGFGKPAAAAEVAARRAPAGTVPAAPSPGRAAGTVPAAPPPGRPAGT